MVQLSTKSYQMDLFQTFYMAFAKSMGLAVLSALSFHGLTPITTISFLTLFLYSSQFRPTNTPSKTLSFADWAKKCKHDNGIMHSLVVFCLFTYVPPEETLDICLDKLYSIADPLPWCQRIFLFYQEKPLGPGY